MERAEQNDRPYLRYARKSRFVIETLWQARVRARRRTAALKID
jgi:hypothetical protein